MFSLVPKLSIAEIEPRQFLRYCFSVDQLSLEEILVEVTSFSYCAQCVRLLSKILGIQRKTVRSRGENPNFEGMPQYARMTCNYVQLALSKEELNRIINQDAGTTKANCNGIHRGDAA
ncbi:MAG: hypothetical protein AAFW70_22670 [Cyanobacteria bacterium J06635_10]